MFGLAYPILMAAEPAANDPTTEIIIAALGSAGLGAIIAAIVTGLFSKRKLGAEATEIITKAASGVVAMLEADNVRAQARIKELTEENAADRRAAEDRMIALVASHEEEIEEYRRVLQLHVAWDVIAIAELRKLKIELPPAPPLQPARRFDHPKL